MKIKIYGSRGSIPLSGSTHTIFGGNSSCTVLDIDGQFIVLDCGSGLIRFYEENKERFTTGLKLNILLSHLHLDHIIGFSMFPPILSPDSDINIYTRSRNEQPLKSQVFGVFKPPYWPIEIAKITKAKVTELVDEKPFLLEKDISVTPFFTELHDKSTAFRIDAGKSVVYLLDYEMQENEDKKDKLIRFCENADLIIFDASYLPEDYPKRRGWGHSTPDDGIILAEASGCKKMIFSHLSQEYTDDVLTGQREKLDAARYLIAYDGMEMEI